MIMKTFIKRKKAVHALKGTNGTTKKLNRL